MFWKHGLTVTERNKMRNPELTSLDLAIEMGETVDYIEKVLCILVERGYLKKIKTIEGVSTFGHTLKGTKEYIRLKKNNKLSDPFLSFFERGK
jgi:hypothetical protein